MIGVLDYGAGNLGSVMNALERLGRPARFVGGPEELGADSPYSALIFPGDGHFETAMRELRAGGYVQALQDWAAADRPFLGICIGLQLLFESSEEAPGVEGLGILKGMVKRFPCRKVPQIGWNQASAMRGSRLFKGLKENSFFYFIHSYYVAPEAKQCVAAEADYSLRYCCAVEQGNLAAVQFHPEKSGDSGIRLLDNWFDAMGLKGQTC